MYRVGAKLWRAYKDAVALWIYLLLVFTISILIFAVVTLLPLFFLLMLIFVHPMWAVVAILAYFPVVFVVSAVLGLPLMVAILLGWWTTEDSRGRRGC